MHQSQALGQLADLMLDRAHSLGKIGRLVLGAVDRRANGTQVIEDEVVDLLRVPGAQT
jgi:hypothetical protein